jgi:hypothetical protein
VTLAEIMEEIAAALEPISDEVEGLQVYPFFNANPTPPALDIYPASPFQTGAGFGPDAQIFFTIRARVSTADQEAAMRLLLRLLDTNDPASVEAAIAARAAVTPEGVSDFREYTDGQLADGRLLGCEWQVTRFLNE